MKLQYLSYLAAYLIGSIPTAYIYGRVYKDIDIRKHGSGNVGATNTFRVLGKGPGIIVLVIDILKGVVATTLVPYVFQTTSVWAIILLGVCAVIGHNWTVFLNFKGGKGIATSLGVLIGLAITFSSMRIVLVSTLGLWAVVFLLSGYVSLASLVAAIFLPVLMVATTQPFVLVALGVVICVFVVVRHRANIKRLLLGQESRVKLPFQKVK
ncbi:MAG: acyl-phosphate glycerol 3-phosphate acyltransferase [Omnitrophica WOR_2 bacterium GWA2_47_8]|nr:MAG: acyl-phosphate glycerol 3-phosphate acyltransferase [Omnitrophica WOR_2 bacterium GWA2_47_8]